MVSAKQQLRLQLVQLVMNESHEGREVRGVIEDAKELESYITQEESKKLEMQLDASQAYAKHIEEREGKAREEIIRLAESLPRVQRFQIQGVLGR